jgi:hypothetical protein
MDAGHIQANNALRLIALTTTDDIAKKLALDVLNESENEAREQIGQTCYEEDMSDLRGALETQYKS